MVTLDGRVLRDKEREVRVVVDIKEGEFILCDEWLCKQEERIEERR